MKNENPATPAPAATPGSQEPKVITPPSTPTTPPTGGQAPEEGKVTLSTKEYSAINRDAARYRSLQRRGELSKNKEPSVNNPSGDPDIDKIISDANTRAENAEREALQYRVKSEVRSLLDKEEFKNLPLSTKELILQNPHMLSTADNLEEAMLDIEDFLRETSAKIEHSNPTIPGSGSTPKGNEPEGTTTPPSTGSGGSAPAGNAELEDVSKLSGPSKTQAMIRNSLKKNKQS